MDTIQKKIRTKKVVKLMAIISMIVFAFIKWTTISIIVALILFILFLVALAINSQD